MALLEALESTRLRLLEAIEPLDDDALLRPGVFGSYSPRDVLVLITTWQAELVTGLMKLRQGKKPVRLLAALADPAAYDARRLRENEGRDLDRIFEDLQGVYTQLERWLDEFSDREFTKAGVFKGLGQRPLWSLVRAASFGRELRYIPALQALSDRVDEGEIVARENGHEQ